MIRRFVFLVLLCAAASYGAQPKSDSPVRIEGDLQTVDATTGEYVLKGHTYLTDGAVLLVADEMRARQVGKAYVVTAVGHIEFTRGPVRLLADRLVYHQNDGTFTAENVRLGSYPYFAEGFSAEGTPDEITIRRARVSYGEPGPWQPTLTADTIIVAPGERLRAENAAVGIGHLQPVPFPKYQHNIAQPVAIATTLNGGFRRSLGVFVEAEPLVPVSENARIGADLGIYTNRGVMFGPAARYANSEDPDALHGFLHSGYINDHGDKGTDLRGKAIPEDRAFIEWQHQQTLAPNLTLNAQLNWWRDSEVVRDFKPRAFFPVQEPDTFVESVYTGENYFVSAFARFQPNRFHRVQERLPEIRFDLLPFAIGNGFYERFNASAAVLHEDSPGNSVTSAAISPAPPTVRPVPATTITTVPSLKQSTNRLDAYYAIERPVALTDWLALTPIAGGRVTHYFNSKETFLTINPAVGSFGSTQVVPDNYTRALGELGADLVARASGTFDYKNPQWKIDGLRHLVTPRLSYRYIPEADKGRAQIPAIDREVFSTYLQPLGLGEVRNIDDLHGTNTLRLAVDNVLQTRDAKDGTRDLASFTAATDFRFRHGPFERTTSRVHTDFSLTPARWLQFEFYQSLVPQTFTLAELNSAITIRDGGAWSLRFANNFLRPQPEDMPNNRRAAPDFVQTHIEDYLVDGRLRINERFEALTRLHYDQRKHRFNEQSYGITQNLGNTWLVSYMVSLYSGRRRESSFGFRVEIDTVRF